MAKEIVLRNGMVSIVDDEDFDRLNQFKWYYTSDGYAIASNGKNKTVRLHRLVIGDIPTDKVVDHINRNKLDNRKSNLRICTRAENTRNAKKPSTGITSKYKGVSIDGDNYRARISVNGKIVHIGTFTNEDAAAMAYNVAAIKYHQEFASLNEVDVKDFNRYMCVDSSRYVGISKDKRSGRYHAYIRNIDGKRLHLGYFDSEFDAVIAYNTKAVELYGINAKLNVVHDHYLPNKIAINGRSLSGKDTIADMLISSFGYTRISFSTPIYTIARDLFGMTTKDRKLLQDIGAAMRSIDQDVFIKWAMKEADKYDKVIISDVRQQNEHEHLTKNGFFPIRVNADFGLRIQRCIDRDGIQPDTSLWEAAGEVGADNCHYEVEIENNDSLSELYSQVVKKLQQHETLLR